MSIVLITLFLLLSHRNFALKAASSALELSYHQLIVSWKKFCIHHSLIAFATLGVGLRAQYVVQKIPCMSKHKNSFHSAVWACCSSRSSSDEGFEVNNRTQNCSSRRNHHVIIFPHCRTLVWLRDVKNTFSCVASCYGNLILHWRCIIPCSPLPCPHGLHFKIPWEKNVVDGKFSGRFLQWI